MMTGDKNKDVVESSEVLSSSSNDIERKRNSHENEQKSNFHEIELKTNSHDTEESRSSHDTEEKTDSPEKEEKTNPHEGGEPPEKGSITTKSSNTSPIKKKRGGWKLAILLHENEQKSNFHEIERKTNSHDTEESRSSHDTEEKTDSPEKEEKTNPHEGGEPPEKGSITTKSSNTSPIKKKRGGWKLAILLLVNQGLATLAFFGVGVNLVLFLVRVLEQSNAVAANNVSKWTGTVYLFSLVGAFLSDSYWGRYLTCAVFQVFFVMGLGLMSLTSWFFLLHPSGCGDGEKLCNPPSQAGVILFYLSIYLVAFGYGGHQPTIATFGADQFDEADPEQQSSRAVFFSYFYFALNVGCLFSNTILVYYEDHGYWTIGFLASLGSAVVALLSYLMGSRRYRYIKPCGNPLPRVAQVFVAAARKWHVVPANANNLYEVEGKESAIKGSRKILHSNEIEFLDKAATITDRDQNEKNPWRLCTVTQVEEAKCVLKLLPIWLCTIIYSVIFTQMASLFVEQGDVMHAHIGNFHLPAASMSAFDICSVLIATAIYRQVLVPLAGRLSGNPKGLSELQRMGIGLIIGMLSMVAAGATEIARLQYVEPGKRVSSLSIFWQIPQYVLVGVSEVFMYVGQLEFFNGEAPDGIKSFGSSLCMASISLGNYVSSMLVAMVMGITARGSNPGWIPNDLNTGHMERFYFLIAGLTVLDFVIYLYLAKRYKYINLEGPENEEESQESQDDEVLRSA